MRCRILYLVGELGLGGLQRQLCLLLERMDRDRYRPALVVWDRYGDSDYVERIRGLNVPVYFLPRHISASFKLFAFRQLVNRLTPEVVHSFSFYTNFPAVWATFGSQAVPVGSVRGDFFRDKGRCGPLLGRLNARWPRYQIFNNRAAAQRVGHRKSLFSPERAHVVRNGIDLNDFQMIPFRQNGQIASVIGVGSLLQVKRWDVLLKAAKELKQRGLNYHIRIAGRGPMRETLESQVQELGLQDQITFLGHVNNVSQLLSEGNFLVHTSDAEGCPNVVMEAMACGRAVIATDAGDVPFLVENGQSGFVVPRGDQKALTDCIEKLIKDPELCWRMGQTGRQKAEREFSLDRVVSETLEAYRTAGWKHF
jgi:glycosyltransferase involved in cell wall biosynthesis